jgi:hypothetical protein
VSTPRPPGDGRLERANNLSTCSRFGGTRRLPRPTAPAVGGGTPRSTAPAVGGGTPRSTASAVGGGTRKRACFGRFVEGSTSGCTGVDREGASASTAPRGGQLGPLFYVTNLQVEAASAVEAQQEQKPMEGRGQGSHPATGKELGPEASAEQRLEGGRAAGKGLRFCTGWEATPGRQRGCRDASPPADGEVLRRVPALRERGPRASRFGEMCSATGSGSPDGGGRRVLATQRTLAGTGCKTPGAVTRSKPSRW